MSKALERRAKFREELILAAERSISAGGLAGLKTRELAREIGVANGAVYNLVEDMDELILRVGSRTLARLDASLTCGRKRRAPPRLAKRWCASRSPIAISPLKISNYGARCSNTGWRRASPFRNGRSANRWICSAISIVRSPNCFQSERRLELGVTARSLFSAVHGMVLLGLEQKLIAVPVIELRKEIAIIVGAMVDGLSGKRLVQ